MGILRALHTNKSVGFGEEMGWGRVVARAGDAMLLANRMEIDGVSVNVCVCLLVRKRAGSSLQ